jgi:hypothetical protein
MVGEVQDDAVDIARLRGSGEAVENDLPDSPWL